MGLSWLQWMSMTADSLSVLLNLSLLLPIIFFSGNHIGQYKYLLFLYSLSSIIYSSTQVFNLATFYVSDKGFYFYATVAWVPRAASIALMFTMISCYLQIIIILNLSFIYRLFVMRNPFLLSWFHEKSKIALIAMMSSVLIISMMSCCVYGMLPNERVDLLIRDDLLISTGVDIRVYGYIGAPIYIDGRVNFSMLLVMITFATFVVISGIAVGTWIKIISAGFQGTSTITSSTHKAQRRLFTLLLLQSSFPILFTFAPPLIGWVLALLSISAGETVEYLGPLLSFAQVIDPLLMFYFIRDYHTAVYAFFCCNRRKTKVNETAPTSRSVQREHIVA